MRCVWWWWWGCRSQLQATARNRVVVVVTVTVTVTVSGRCRGWLVRGGGGLVPGVEKDGGRRVGVS